MVAEGFVEMVVGLFASWFVVCLVCQSGLRRRFFPPFFVFLCACDAVDVRVSGQGSLYVWKVVHVNIKFISCSSDMVECT